MIKTISKVGNSHGIIFDSALLQMSRLNPGDKVNVEVHPGGTITLTPLEPKKFEANEAKVSARDLIKKNSELFEKLS